MAVYIRRIPVTPLKAVDWAQISCFSVDADAVEVFFGAVASPDVDVFLFEFLCVSGAFDEPEEFFSESPPEHFFVGEEGEGLGEVVLHHAPENGFGACLGAVHLFLPVLDNVLDSPQVLVFFVFSHSKQVFVWTAVFLLVVVLPEVKSQSILPECFGNKAALQLILVARGKHIALHLISHQSLVHIPAVRKGFLENARTSDHEGSPFGLKLPRELECFFETANLLD